MAHAEAKPPQLCLRRHTGAQRAPRALPVLSTALLENCRGRICRRRHTPRQRQPPRSSGRSGAGAYGAPHAPTDGATEPRAFCSARKGVDAHAPAPRAGQSCREASAMPAYIKSRPALAHAEAKPRGCCRGALPEPGRRGGAGPLRRPGACGTFPFLSDARPAARGGRFCARTHARIMRQKIFCLPP